MSSIAVLKKKNAELKQQSHKKCDNQPISLLKFLRSENRKLRRMASQLEADLLTLRAANQKRQKT